MRSRRVLALSCAVGAGTLLLGTWAAVAGAITAGPNPPSSNGCPTFDNASTFTGVYPGCHNLQVTVTDGNGNTYAEAGMNQLPNGENYHSGTFMVTPNGDGNPYGNENGQPTGTQTQTDSDFASQSQNGCPTTAQYPSSDIGSGQTETDNGTGTQSGTTQGGCPQQGYAPVSGPGVGSGFDTNYQPFPTYECGVEDIALYGVEWLEYAGGLSTHQCAFAPVGWDGPFTPLTDNQGQASHPFDPANLAAFSPDWITSLHPEWRVPSAAPAASPWVSTGAPNTNALALIMTGGQLFIGGDDNGDTGEHDGTDGQYGSGNTFNGSSDGGAFVLDGAPLSGAGTMASWTSLFTEAAGSGSLTTLAPVFENPMPLASFGGGACADQICAGAYTSQRTLYSGGGGSNGSGANGNSRDIYNYQEPNGQPKDWTPYNCNSGSPQSEQACTTQPGSNGYTAACPSSDSTNPTGNANDPSCGANYYKQQEASNVTSEPGVMVYADPDPQASPVAPFDPIPSAYVGTCGVVVGGGTPASQADSGLPVTVPAVPGLTAPAPSIPSQLAPLASTNSAGQLVLADPTGC